MKKQCTCILIMLVSCVAMGVPSYDMTIDMNKPNEPLKPLVMAQGFTPLLRVYIEQAGSTYTNISTDEAVFYYNTNGTASAFAIVTNDSLSTADGYFDLNFTAAKLNTNGTFWYTVVLQTAGGGKYYSGDGSLNITKTTVGGSIGAVDFNTPIDWEGAIYINPQDGPIAAGSGIGAETNATTGQITLSKTSSGDELVGGTNIVIVTNGITRTINTDGNLQAQITANSTTGAAHTVSIADNATAIGNNSATGATHTVDISNLTSTQAIHTTEISALITTQALVKATADGALQVDGSKEMEANLGLGGNNITNVAQVKGSGTDYISFGDDLGIWGSDAALMNIILDGQSGGIFFSKFIAPVMTISTNPRVVIHTDLDMDGNDITNAADVDVTGNMNAGTVTEGATNILAAAVAAQATADGALQVDGSKEMEANLGMGGGYVTNCSGIKAGSVGSSGIGMADGGDVFINAVGAGTGDLGMNFDGNANGSIGIYNLFTPMWVVNTNGTFVVSAPQTNEKDVTMLGDLNVTSNISADTVDSTFVNLTVAQFPDSVIQNSGGTIWQADKNTPIAMQSSNGLHSVGVLFDRVQLTDVVVLGNLAASNGTFSLATGRFSDSIFTDRDFDAMSPTSDEIPSAGWVRSLSQSGQQWFFTTNVNAAAWAKTANFVDLSIEVQSQFTNGIASPIVSDTYLAGGITTQSFGSLRSPMGFEVYLNRVGGNASTEIPVHPEIYYVYNGETNQLGDWEVADQVVDATTPTLYNFTVPFTEPVLTASVQVVAYLKSGTVSGTAAGLNIYGGGVYPSHMDISAVAAGESFEDALHINGDNAMEADIDLGGNSVSNTTSIVFTNGATWQAGNLGGTNGLYSTAPSGTNYWIMTP